MPSVNNTTYRYIALESIQFEREFLRILQSIWEVYPAEGPVQIQNDVCVPPCHPLAVLGGRIYILLPIILR